MKYYWNIAIQIASFCVWRLWGSVALVPVLLVFISVAMLAGLDHCSEQLKTFIPGGLKMRSEKSTKTVTRKGPQMDFKSRTKSMKAFSGRVSKWGLKRDPLHDQEK